RTADQRLQRFRAAGEVVDRDVQPFLLEEALALGDGQREVVEKRLAADAQGQVRLFRRGVLRRRRQHAEGRRGKAYARGSDQEVSAFHGFSSFMVSDKAQRPRHARSRFSTSPTSQSTSRTKAMSTNMPANTPVTS